MSNILGVSGSTIMSESKLFDELLSYDTEHIEIGEFANIDEYILMMDKINNKGISFGIHSPILRNMSKYDLIEEVHFSPKYALEQVTNEADRLSKTSCEYLLVHFPFFEQEKDISRLDEIEDGLNKLSEISEKYNIDIVCEPKLNGYMSPYTINMMDSVPVSMWAKYGIKICIDLGDYLLAADKRLEEMVYKWMDFIKVVHMHNVKFDTRYRWIPLHPEDEQTREYNLDGIIKEIAKKDDVFFVMEPTPHMYRPKEYMVDGLAWVKGLIR